MRCPVASGNPEVLLDYSAGCLDGGTEAALARHLQECAECSRVYEAQRGVWAALDEWEGPTVSADFDAKLYARIEADSRRPFWQRMLGEGFGWRPAAVASACAAAVLGVVLMIPGQNGHGVAPAAPPAASEMQKAEASVEAEQIDRALEDLEMLRQMDANQQL